MDPRSKNEMHPPSTLLYSLGLINSPYTINLLVYPEENDKNLTFLRTEKASQNQNSQNQKSRNL